MYGIIGAFISLVIPFFLMLNNQDNHLERAQSLCPFKMLTGFPCPGCGITKSLVYFYEGNFEKSISYHILGPFVILFCIAMILLLIVELITKRDYCSVLFFNKKLAYGLGFFLGFYHFIRIIIFISHNSFDDILQQSIWK